MNGFQSFWEIKIKELALGSVFLGTQEFKVLV